MSKSTSKPPTIEDGILQFVADGEKEISEIKEAVEGKPGSIVQTVTRLKQAGKLKRVRQGVYRLPSPQESLPDAPAEAENSRGEAENTETINKMLNLYDKLLDAVAVSIEKEDWGSIAEKNEAIKSLRWLGATVDQLMKRWYLLHRGYDTNTRQAVEDAKHKTENREKQEQENAPPEDQVVVVREYDESMRRALANLPGKELKKRTV